MKKYAWLIGLGALAGCAASSAQGGSTLSREEQLQSLQVFAGDMMGSVAKGDFSRVMASAGPESVVYELGDDGKPMSVQLGKAEVFELLDSYQKMMSESGATSKSSP